MGKTDCGRFHAKDYQTIKTKFGTVDYVDEMKNHAEIDRNSFAGVYPTHNCDLDLSKESRG